MGVAICRRREMERDRGFGVKATKFKQQRDDNFQR
jgi:hypothetical protein